MDGLYKVRIMSGTVPAAAASGRYIDCWQHVENGDVMRYVDANLNEITLPAVHEAIVLDPDLLIEPNGKRFTEASTDELIATGWLPSPVPVPVPDEPVP